MRRVTAAQTVLIGVDGGASRVRAHRVEPPKDGGRFALAAERAESPHDGDAQTCVVAAAACIAKVAERAGGGRVLFGMGMPGIKTADGRGIVKALHGPVASNFLARLEKRLSSFGVELERSCERLDGDGYLCGVGEEHAEEGLFHAVRNAYYVGGGTGVAECLKLDGQVVALEDAHVLRAWELGAEEGVSLSSINASLRERVAEKTLDVFEDAARSLGELIRQRCEELPLERVVVGQRLGELFARPDLRPLLPVGLAAAGVNPALVVLSRLPEAPALGAAVLAYERARGVVDG